MSDSVPHTQLFGDGERGIFMKRQSARAITIDSNVRCDRVYPTEDSKRTVADLQTVGIKLNKEQAIHLSRVLLAVTQEWDEVDITAYRFKKRQDDGTYLVTVTSKVEAEGEGEATS
jgi:hypothetical protein